MRRGRRMGRRCSAWRLMLIEVRQEGRVCRVTLNRPEKRNALNVELCRELAEAFDRANADPSVGAILLNANGPSFCAGMDLGETSDAEIHERLFTTIHRVRTPIIAAVHGAALAGGTGLVANAHIVFAKPDARFGLTEIRIGLWPVMIFRAVVQAMGERRAVELSLSGREFGAADALLYGLVSEVADDPLGRAAEVAQRIAGFSPVAVRAGLDYVDQMRGRDWEQAGEIGRGIRAGLLENEDFKEGARAFLEKRQPSWPSLK
jgi:enoyl-CoA hydratase/carnithine racemase